MNLTYSKIVLMSLELDNRGKGRDVTAAVQLSMQGTRTAELLESQYIRVSTFLKFDQSIHCVLAASFNPLNNISLLGDGKTNP